MRESKRTLLSLTMAIVAVALTMGLAPAMAWAAPADGPVESGLRLTAGDCGLQAEAANDTITVFVTISNKGVLALAHQEVDVSDIDNDGKFTYDEAMVAAHEKFCPGGYEATKTAYGVRVDKIWGMNGSFIEYVNDRPILGMEDEIAEGDDLVVGVMADTTNYSDVYACFDKKQVTVQVDEHVSFRLTAVTFDENFNLVEKPAAGVQIGELIDGNFVETYQGITNDDGFVTLGYDAPGIYITTANGMFEGGRIVAPVCVVTVEKFQNTLQASPMAAKSIPAATYNKAKTIAASKAIAVSNAQGAVTYKKSSGNAKISVASNGTITIGKGLKAGTYAVGISVMAAGNDNYKAATKNVTVTLKVNKAANTMKVSSKAKTIDLAKVKKKAVVVAPLKVSKAKGSKVFKITKWIKGTSKGKKYLKINSKTGKITAKKGTPKGTYKFKVRVTAKGNKNFKAKTVTKTVTVKVK